MQVVSKLTLTYTYALPFLSHLFDSECLQVVWGECEERDLLNRLPRAVPSCQSFTVGPMALPLLV